MPFRPNNALNWDDVHRLGQAPVCRPGSLELRGITEIAGMGTLSGYRGL